MVKDAPEKEILSLLVEALAGICRVQKIIEESLLDPQLHSSATLQHTAKRVSEVAGCLEQVIGLRATLVEKKFLSELPGDPAPHPQG